MKRINRYAGLLLVGAAFLQLSCSSNNGPSSPSGGNNTPAYTYPFLLFFGDSGNGSGQFSGPNQAVVSNNAIYVADQNNFRVQKFDLNGNVLGVWGGNHPFGGVLGITADKNGTLYVADYGHSQVETADFNLNYLATYGPTVGPFVLSSPFGLNVDNGGTSILMADGGTQKVYRFNSTFTAGVSVNFSFGEPWDVAEDGGGNVYVTDEGNNDVIKFNSSLASPTTLIGSGSTNGTVTSPFGIAVDSDGNLWVGDSTGRVQKVSPSGSYITQLAAPGGGSFETGGLEIAIDPNKNLYICDYYANQIDKYAPY